MISFILFLTCARLRCLREGAGLTRFLVSALYMSCRARLCWLWISRIMRLASALSSRRFCSWISRIMLLPIAFCSLRSRSLICCRCISCIIRFPSFELIIVYSYFILGLVRVDRLGSALECELNIKITLTPPISILNDAVKKDYHMDATSTKR